MTLNNSLQRLLEAFPEDVLDQDARRELRLRVNDLESLRHLNRTDLGEALDRIPKHFWLLLDLVNESVRSILIDNLKQSDDEELRSAISLCAREIFAGDTKSSVVSFFFRNRKYLCVSRSPYGSAFKFQLYPREIITEALRHDANEVYVAVNFPYGMRDQEKPMLQSVSDLAYAATTLEITVADPIILSVAPQDSNDTLFSGRMIPSN